MTAEIATTLIGMTYALSAALALVLVLRRPLGRVSGAGPAYCLWLIVPSVAAAALVPDLQVRPAAAVLSLRSVAGAALPALPPAPIAALAIVVLAWGAGALLLAAWFWRAHVRFVRGLGVLQPADGIFFSSSQHGGPASLGLWRPRLIVPFDFRTRYTAAEQILIIRHEQVHAERFDAVANLVQVCLQCVFWFNPLVHFAAVRFRADQELACDAAVLHRHRGQSRAYAQALLKSHSFSTAAPATVACHWQSNHPIKERVMSLKQGHPGKFRRLAGRFAVLSLVLGAGVASMLARADVAAAPAAADYDVAMTLSVDGAQASPRLLARGGEAFAVASEQDGAKWKAEFTITRAGVDTVWIAGKIDRDSTPVARPTLQGRLGEPVGVKVDDAGGRSVALTMVVRAVPARPAPP